MGRIDHRPCDASRIRKSGSCRSGQFVQVKSIRPKFLRGAYRSSLRVALTEADLGYAAGDDARVSRAWKLFLLLPRMLLHKPVRGGLVPKVKLKERFILFIAGSVGGSDFRKPAV